MNAYPEGMRNLLFLVVLGLIVYTLISLYLRSRSGPSGGGGTGRAWRKPKPPAGPVAPDDDPEFLWRLDQQQRRADRDANTPRDAAAPEASDVEGDGSDQDQPGSRGTAS